MGRRQGLGKLFVFCCAAALLSLEQSNFSDLSDSSPDISVTGSAIVTIELSENSENSPPVVALTFDDGPLRSTTTELLDGLALREIPATFFLVGDHIAGNEDLILRMDEEGHQIGLHSYDHIYLQDLSREDFDFQVAKPRAILSALLPDEDFWLRPPYGIFDRATELWAGTPIILWSLDPEDWKYQDAQYIAGVVLDQVQDGDIILLHDIYPTTVEATLLIADGLMQQGYEFATVAQLLELKGIQPMAGEVYTGNYPH